MKAKRLLLSVALLAAAGLWTVPVNAQERDRDRRRELEERLRELREEIEEIEAEMGRRRWDVAFRGAFDRAEPFRVLTFPRNRARLGVVVRTAADEETDRTGALIQSVTPDGPADEAGLQAGDIITQFDRESLVGRYPAAAPDESEPARKLIDLVGELELGDTVAIEYHRDDQTRNTTAVLRRIDEDDFAFRWNSPDVELRRGVRVFAEPGRRSAVISVLSDAWSEIELVSLNEGLGRYFGTDEGLLVIRAPDESLDLQAGDVILSIDGREPRSPSRALRILRSYEPGEEVSMEIMRDLNRMTIAATVPEPEGWYDRRWRDNWY
jgi:C-terminal processing protease CtpA/Prc